MYTEDDIKVLNWRDVVRKNQCMYFGSRGANPQSISSDIAHGALVLGAENVRILHLNDWWLILSEIDWLKVSTKIETDEYSIFESLFGFPEAGQNWYRSEGMASLFSSVLITYDGANSRIVKGSEPELNEFIALCTSYEYANRIVGFKFSDEK